MDNRDNIIIELSERVAVLETNQEILQKTMTDISGKLDDLLTLKNKGMGALSLVGIVIGSGILGVIALIVNVFRGGGGPSL